jgi:voltage-gated sodium channel
MTLEGWSEEIARPVMEVFPSAWVFFILFILTATFIVVNLFVAVIVDSINSIKLAEVTELQGSTSSNELQQIKNELNEMKALIQNLKQTLELR